MAAGLCSSKYFSQNWFPVCGSLATLLERIMRRGSFKHLQRSSMCFSRIPKGFRLINPNRPTTQNLKMTPLKITFFKSQSYLRRWFAKHHLTSQELWVGYYKKSSGKSSITWPESVDEALCFGWIDGIRKSVDDDSYTIRCTPRKQRSTWSAVNIKRAQELIDQGLMQPAGLKAFQRAKKTGRASIPMSKGVRSYPVHIRGC